MTPAPAGHRLGPYEVVRHIGGGGMGEVYLAHDSRLHRNVALKLLPREWSRDSRLKERFTREVRAVSALDHPNICTLYDIGESEGQLFLVMAHYEGMTLRSKLREGALTLDEAVGFAVQIGRGLAWAHASGIVHRDIKPANIMIANHGGPAAPGQAAPGQIKILDFGIAKIAGEADLTEPGVALGTPAYMSPEQAGGQEVGHRTDIWALGVVLYEMIAGRPPFQGERSQAILYAILNREPEPLGQWRQGLPEALERTVAKALAKDVDARYANVNELLVDLGAEVEGTASHAVPISAPAGTGPWPTGPHTRTEETGRVPVIRVLMVTDLVESTKLVESLGDARAYDLSERHDRMARDLLTHFDGLEIDKSDGFLLLFERPADAVAYAQAYHQALARLSREEDVELAARVGIHLGEVMLRRNSQVDVARGAKPLEVEGLAKPIAARVMALAEGRQTLMTQGAFDLARRAVVSGELGDPELRWLAHGTYAFRGVKDPMEVFEVGIKDFAPLSQPKSSTSARHGVAIGDELTLGWRPAVGQMIPFRPNWSLVERVGQGGFGEVWLARHKSGEKRVFKFCFEAARLRALKREVTLFRLLKDALGHRQDIARILDWNFDESPYFLEAEYTEGGNLVEWAEAQGGLAEVPLATRLELVAQIAEALAAAHSVGILHKDVKPSNILVAAADSENPRARLTDFGIGFLADRERLEAPGVTVLGFTETSLSEESVGTAGYMAPELLAGKPATMQADIYSLGVVLYQAVVGDFSRALASGWRRHVAHELLAEDIAAFVDGSPELRPASALEVASRLRQLDERQAEREAERRARDAAEADRRALEKSRRRRKLVVAALLVMTLIAAVTTVQSMRVAREAERANQEAARANQEAARAEREAAGAREVSQFMVELFQVSDPSEGRGNSVTVREILDAGALRITDELTEQPGTQERLMLTIGQVYDQLGLYEQAIVLLEDALLIRREKLEPHSPELAQNLLALARPYWYQGRMAEAIGLAREAIEVQERYLEPEDPELVRAMNMLGNLYTTEGRYFDAEELYREALARMRRVTPDGRDPVQHQRYLGWALNNTGYVLNYLARYREAVELHLESRELRRAAVGEKSVEYAWSLQNLGVSYTGLGRYREAGELLEEAQAIRRENLDADHPDIGWGLTKLALLDHERGLNGSAIERFEQALELYGDHDRALEARLGLAEVLTAVRRYDEAEAQYAEIRLLLEPRAAEHPERADYFCGLGELRRRQRRWDEAREALEQGLAINSKGRGEDHPASAENLERRANLRREVGEGEAAERDYQDALRVRLAALGPQHPHAERWWLDYSEFLRAAGRSGELDALRRRLLADAVKAESAAP